MLTESRSRLDALRELLKEGSLSTQEDLRDKLERMRFAVTQSTVSRDLRKIGAVKATDPEGRTIYRLPEEDAAPTMVGALMDLVRDIQANQSLVVIHTSPGSASFVARHLDRTRPAGILGTIAGDDTIFVAPSPRRQIEATIREIRQSLGYAE